MFKTLLAIIVAWSTGILLVVLTMGPRVAVAQQAVAPTGQAGALPSWAAPLAGFVGYMLWEAWLGATKRVAAGSTLGLIVNIVKAIVGAVAGAANKPNDPSAKSDPQAKS